MYDYNWLILQKRFAIFCTSQHVKQHGEGHRILSFYEDNSICYCLDKYVCRRKFSCYPISVLNHAQCQNVLSYSVLSDDIAVIQ